MRITIPTWLVQQIIALVFGVALILPALIHLEAKLTRDALVNSERFASVRGITHTTGE